MPEAAYWATFFDCACVLSRLECNQNCVDVVEFGCGYGDFTIQAARVVQGDVYALDIEPEMVEATVARAALNQLTNVSAAVRDFVERGAGRPDASVDYVMLFNILHIERPVELLAESLRILRPAGKVGIIHWQYDPKTPRGPSMNIRPRPEQCRDWGVEAGLVFDRWESLPCCPHHYGLVLRKAE